MSLAVFAGFISGLKQVSACKDTSYVNVSNLCK